MANKYCYCDRHLPRDNVYGAVITEKVVARVHSVHRMNVKQSQVAAD